MEKQSLDDSTAHLFTIQLTEYFKPALDNTSQGEKKKKERERDLLKYLYS